VGDPLAGELVVGISTRALFHLDDADEVLTRPGLDAYRESQRAHEPDVLEPGSVKSWPRLHL
jgi:5'-nucleotidase